MEWSPGARLGAWLFRPALTPALSPQEREERPTIAGSYGEVWVSSAPGVAKSIGGPPSPAASAEALAARRPSSPEEREELWGGDPHLRVVPDFEAKPVIRGRGRVSGSGSGPWKLPGIGDSLE